MLDPDLLKMNANMQPCTLQSLMQFLSRYGTIGRHTHVGRIAVLGYSFQMDPGSLIKDPTTTTKEEGGYLIYYLFFEATTLTKFKIIYKEFVAIFDPKKCNCAAEATFWATQQRIAIT
jgi:hypothetical protein